jgi:thiosulfate/3-mercaptopyruvate sulfurtransferase
MLPAGALERRLEELGVSDDSRIVLCHVLGDVTTAARAFVTLDRLGLADRTHILDGGLEAWKAEGRVVSTEAPKPRRGRLTPKPRADVLADLAYMSSHYRDQGVRVVDARPGGAYRGSAGTGTPRGGHIPGAVNVPYSSLIDSTGRYLPVDSLKTRFETAGVHPGDEVISYCYIGRTASPVYVAARMLGHRVRLYDGSFEQWSRRIELPVEGEPAK